MHRFNKFFTQWDERKKRIDIEKDRKDKEEAKRKHTQELKEKIDSRKREEGYQEKVINEEIEPDNSMKPDKELESNKPDQKELEKIEKEKYIDQIPKTDDVQNLDEEPDLDNLNPDIDLPKNKDLHIEEIIENEEVDLDEIEERKKTKEKISITIIRITRESSQYF